MSNYNENEEIKNIGIGRILRTINNQLAFRSEHKNSDGSDKTRPITVQHLQDSKSISKALERVEMICKEMNIVKRDRKHAEFVSNTSGDILRRLGFPAKDVNLAEVAGYLHDLGYRLDIEKHSFIGAGMAYEILSGFNMAQDEIDKVCLAIAYHNDSPVNKIGAALSIAEACDFNKMRVRDNFANDIFSNFLKRCTSFEVEVNTDQKVIRLKLAVDGDNDTVKKDFITSETKKYERCKEAADFLGCNYEVMINGEVL